ncbi:sulfatase-like hydrolase/transferase [bacterium]|nr:sulfatase-like hydrolase/transferase [bacterium]
MLPALRIAVPRVLVTFVVAGLLLSSFGRCWGDPPTSDSIGTLQQQNAESNQPTAIHWGPDTKKYSSWGSHSNRLIPVYTFGIDLAAFQGPHSIYRDKEKLKKLYGYLPSHTLNTNAEYFDQTDIYQLQKSAVEQGKKRIILFVFDGMDWQTTWAAATHKAGKVAYRDGRGTGLNFQDYRGVETDFGYFVTSPHDGTTTIDVDKQIVTAPGTKPLGGYDPSSAGGFPWSVPPDVRYPIGQGKQSVHGVTDSAASATSLNAGVKTYNNAINVDFMGREVLPISRQLQADGWHIGVVTSVPISHATPGAAYANNVVRYDYQDITRDLVGLPSSFHPGGIPGVDVLLGSGWGENSKSEKRQGSNYVPGNTYIAGKDLSTIDASNGGKYVIAQRTPGESGEKVLRQGVKTAIQDGDRLFGFFGIGGGHLPFQTADGKFDPASSSGGKGPTKAEKYSDADLKENVTLADMSIAAMDVLEAKGKPWWLMIEAGDVDWANHANNIDNSIGAVLSGDDAFKQVTDWIENHGGWNDTCVILTADHGHYLIIDQPEALTGD